MGFKIYTLSLNYNVYTEVKSIYSHYENDPIISSATFNWINMNSKYFNLLPTLTGDSNKIFDEGVAIFNKNLNSNPYPIGYVINKCNNCSYTKIGKIENSFSTDLTYPWFRDLEIYRYKGNNIENLISGNSVYPEYLK